jgi:hypothetical protein
VRSGNARVRGQQRDAVACLDLCEGAHAHHLAVAAEQQFAWRAPRLLRIGLDNDNARDTRGARDSPCTLTVMNPASAMAPVSNRIEVP